MVWIWGSIIYHYIFYTKSNIDQSVKVDLLVVQKISKRHFLKDIEKSFQEATPIGPEPHHSFFFLKYPNKCSC